MSNLRLARSTDSAPSRTPTPQKRRGYDCKPIAAYPKWLWGEWDDPEVFTGALDLHVRRHEDTGYDLRRAECGRDDEVDTTTFTAWRRGDLEKDAFIAIDGRTPEETRGLRSTGACARRRRSGFSVRTHGRPVFLDKVGVFFVTPGARHVEPDVDAQGTVGSDRFVPRSERGAEAVDYAAAEHLRRRSEPADVNEVAGGGG